MKKNHIFHNHLLIDLFFIVYPYTIKEIFKNIQNKYFLSFLNPQEKIIKLN